jgi:DNA-3-methyladenine glycosylase
MSSACPLLSDLHRLSDDFFEKTVDIVARNLIGTFLVLDHGIGHPAGGRIVETEAYDENDPASHCYRGNGYEPQRKSRPMLLQGGHAYVYGECCLNFVCDKDAFGSAVLIRALKPIWGKPAMRIRQVPYDPEAATNDRRLCSSPMKLGAALGVTYVHNEKSLFEPPFQLYQRIATPCIVCGPRVRVKKFLKDNRPAIDKDLLERAIKRPRRFADGNAEEFVSCREKDSDRKAYPLGLELCE